MSTRSRIVVNPGSGQRRVALSATCDRITVLGAGQGAREERVQPCAEQRLTVRRGRMAVVCDGTLSILEEGESIAIAPGVPHAWWSTRAGELCVEIESDDAPGGAQDPVASGRISPWRSWSWFSHAPTGWAPSASR